MDCQTLEGNLNLVEKDLFSYGIAITIEVPDSADINMMDWGLQKDITIRDESSWYNLQIFSSRALTHNLQKVKDNQLQVVQEGPYFSKIISEDPDGFIFETLVDSMSNYDFRHFKIQGDNEYLFQAGLLGKYSLDQVNQIYEVAQRAR